MDMDIVVFIGIFFFEETHVILNNIFWYENKSLSFILDIIHVLSLFLKSTL